VDNVFEVKCPQCGEEIEFIGNEKHRRCDGCGERVPNPKLAPDEAG
jgi:tRNA(Ile2) C34 agmatinyltransferase TiaS